MHLTDKERQVIERMRAAERKKNGTVECYACGGTGSASQSDCSVCDGAGVLKKNGPEVQKHVRTLTADMKKAVSDYTAAIRLAKGLR